MDHLSKNNVDSRTFLQSSGDVWPAPNYQIATGLAHYDFTDLSADIADKTVANAMKHAASDPLHLPLEIPP